MSGRRYKPSQRNAKKNKSSRGNKSRNRPSKKHSKTNGTSSNQFSITDPDANYQYLPNSGRVPPKNTGLSRPGNRGVGLKSTGARETIHRTNNAKSFRRGAHMPVEAHVHQFCVQGDRVELDQSADKNGPFEGGGFVGFKAIKWTLADFLDPEFYKNFDCYQIREVAVYAHYVPTRPSTSGGTNAVNSQQYGTFSIEIFSSFDPDDSNKSNSWADFRKRGNVKKHLLTKYHPDIHLGTFRPHADFTNDPSNGPENFIPETDLWWDVAQPEQAFIGLKTAQFTPYFDKEAFFPVSVEYYYEATIALRYKI